jgi:hypothetical protein
VGTRLSDDAFSDFANFIEGQPIFIEAANAAFLRGFSEGFSIKAFSQAVEPLRAGLCAAWRLVGAAESALEERHRSLEPPAGTKAHKIRSLLGRTEVLRLRSAVCRDCPPLRSRLSANPTFLRRNRCIVEAVNISMG